MCCVGMMENIKDNDIEFDPESSQFLEPLDINPVAGPSTSSPASNKEFSLLVLRKIFESKLMY